MKSLLHKFPRPGLWAYLLVGVLAFLFLLSTYVRIYSPEFGLTKLIIIGHEFDDRGLASFRETPKFIGVNDRWGFDGQHYAQLSLDPLLRDPQLKTALDNPPLRSRRILMSWLAWLGGLGHPPWVLNAYASLNLVFWVGFALVLTKLFRPLGWAGVAGFSALLVTCGVVDSIGSALTDLPGYVLMILAMVAGGTGGAMLLALAALTREPNIIGVFALLNYRPPWLPTAWRNLILGLIACLPLLAWCAYVVSRFPPSGAVDGGNMSWPLHGILWKLGKFRAQVANGGIHWGNLLPGFYRSEPLHALLTIISILTQCLYLVTHRDWNNRIWRVGMVFVPFFLCIGIPAWESHFTVTRHALPITLAFNLILAMRPRRSWLLWFLLGNCFVPFGLYTNWDYYGRDGSPPPAELKVSTAVPQNPLCTVRFAEGWAAQEWTPKNTWRWAVEQRTSLILTNTTGNVIEGSLTFETRSISAQKLVVRIRDVNIWSTHAGTSMQTARTTRFQLPPGETTVAFETDRAPLPFSGENDDTRRLSFLVQDLRLDLTVAPPANLPSAVEAPNQPQP